MKMIQKMYRRMRLYSYQSLMWLFVWMTFIYQFAFAFVLPYIGGAKGALLYDTMDFEAWVPQVWGVLGVVCLVAMLIAVYTRNKTLTRVFSVGQMMLWVFAFVMYMQGGVYFLAFGVAFTLCLFWAWNMGGREDENARMYRRIKESLDYEI